MLLPSAVLFPSSSCFSNSFSEDLFFLNALILAAELGLILLEPGLLPDLFKADFSNFLLKAKGLSQS
jgi:hypothetical protein